MNRCFKIALALQLNNKAKDALTYCKRAVSTCEARLERLKKQRGKSAENAENLKEPESEKTEVVDIESKLSAEITELEGLLVDLREKVCVVPLWLRAWLIF